MRAATVAASRRLSDVLISNSQIAHAAHAYTVCFIVVRAGLVSVRLSGHELFQQVASNPELDGLVFNGGSFGEPFRAAAVCCGARASGHMHTVM